MARTRIMQASALKGASPVDWERLAHQAIARAEQAGDPRAGAIRTALTQGRASQFLKRLGIIGEIDISREFPTRET
jgi:hypothetical protein